jgi:putative spermidine/putrescine transport system substrate-binding protein
MDRRSFLTGVGLWAAGQLLTGCQGRQQSVLNVHALKGSLPPQLIGRARREISSAATLKLVPDAKLATLFSQLQTWKLNAQDTAVAAAGLVTLGDYWLATAIQQGLLQPLQPAQLPHWQQLPSAWQQLVRRDEQGRVASQGPVWGAPYRWGMTVLAYRKDKFQRLGWQPRDWSDLWRPELQQRISLLDQAREVIGLTLKKLGHSYNTNDLGAIPELQSELAALHRQVLWYSSEMYLQPLLLGDTWLAVGWSHDVLPLMRRNNQIGIVVPQAGTALWADIWVQSAALQQASLAHQWIDFWWQPQIAQGLSNLSNGLSPLLTGRTQQNQAKVPGLPDAQTFQRSEFLTPLPAPAIAQYQRLWRDMRGA